MKPDANKVIALFTHLKDQLGPEQLAYWVLLNTVLTFSGARAYCDGVFWDDRKKGLLEQWDREIAKAATIINNKAKVIWSETGITKARPGEKYAGYGFIFEAGLGYVLKQTQLIDGEPFTQLKQQTSADKDSKILIKNLKSQTRFKDFSEENLDHIAFGILLGYPDKAILGSVQKWESDDPFAEQLVDADIRGASYYTCPQPIYSYPRNLIDDPSIKSNEQLWSKILEGYYKSDFHKSLEKDKAFQNKMRELGNLR